MTVNRPCETLSWQYSVNVTQCYGSFTSVWYAVFLAVKHRLTLMLYSHNTSPYDCFIASTLFHTKTFLSLQCLRPILYFQSTLTQMPKLTLMYSPYDAILPKHCLTFKSDCRNTLSHWSYVHTAITLLCTDVILPERWLVLKLYCQISHWRYCWITASHWHLSVTTQTCTDPTQPVNCTTLSINCRKTVPNWRHISGVILPKNAIQSWLCLDS